MVESSPALHVLGSEVPFELSAPEPSQIMSEENASGGPGGYDMASPEDSSSRPHSPSQRDGGSQGGGAGGGGSSVQNQGGEGTSAKRKRSLPGTPDPNAEVVALSPNTLMATNRFVCEICNKGFQRDQNLQLHRRGHNLPWKLRQRTSKEIRKRVYICPEPTCVHHDPVRALGDLTGIKKHFCRKHGEKKFKCEKCSKRYAVQSDWKAHFKTCGTREYRCDCGTLFSRRDSFITHRAFCDALADVGPGPSSSKPSLIGQGGKGGVGSVPGTSGLGGTGGGPNGDLPSPGSNIGGAGPNSLLQGPKVEGLSFLSNSGWTQQQASGQRQGVPGLGLWLGSGPGSGGQMTPGSVGSDRQLSHRLEQGGQGILDSQLSGMLEKAGINPAVLMHQNALHQQQQQQQMGGGAVPSMSQLLAQRDYQSQGGMQHQQQQHQQQQQQTGGGLPNPQAAAQNSLLASLFNSQGGSAPSSMGGFSGAPQQSLSNALRAAGLSDLLPNGGTPLGQTFNGAGKSDPNSSQMNPSAGRLGGNPAGGGNQGQLAANLAALVSSTQSGMNQMSAQSLLQRALGLGGDSANSLNALGNGWPGVNAVQDQQRRAPGSQHEQLGVFGQGGAGGPQGSFSQGQGNQNSSLADLMGMISQGRSANSGAQNLQDILSMASSQGMLNAGGLASMQNLLSAASGGDPLGRQGMQGQGGTSGEEFKALGMVTRDFLGLAQKISPHDLSGLKDFAALTAQADAGNREQQQQQQLRNAGADGQQPNQQQQRWEG